MNVKKNFKLEIFLLLALVGSMFFVSTPTRADCGLSVAEAFDTDFDTMVEDFLDDFNIPSCALVVINDTETVLTRGYGEKPGIDTVYYMGGFSMILTATAIMKLYEDGLIQLDEDINNYLPYSIVNPHQPSVPITIHQLLVHKSSILNVEAYNEVINNQTYAFPDYLYETLNENGAEYGGTVWSVNGPGVTTYWNEINYEIIAYIAELVTAENFTHYVTSNILTPLGMTGTKTDYTLYNPANIQQGNIVDGVTGEATPVPLSNFDGRGSCGWLTTVEDFAKLANLYKFGKYDGTTILNETSVSTMQTNYGSTLGYAIDVDWDMYGQTYKGLANGVYANLGTYGEIFFDEDLCFAHIYAGWITDSNSSIDDYMLQLHSALRSILPCPPIVDTNMLLVPIICSIAVLSILIAKRRNKN